MIGTTNDNLSAFLASLDDLRETGDRKWQARCPAHDDNRASLSVAVGDGARVLAKCHAGCEFRDIVRAVGLSPSDLAPPHQSNGAQRRILATYDYRDERGELVFQVLRFEPKDFRQRRPDGQGGWSWSVKGCRVLPYRLPQLLDADAAETLLVVEGERDADRLASLGLVATCNAGGAGKWRREHAEFLMGRHVVILPDNDDAGRKHAQQVARSLDGAASVKVVELPGLPPKGDVSDWLDAGGTVEELRAIVEDAPEWRYEPDDDEQADDERSELPTFAGVDIVELRELVNVEPDWIVDRVFTSDQPALFGARSKAGKTTQLSDLAVALASATPWLGFFSVPKRRRVLFVTGESSQRAISRRLLRACQVRGLEFADVAGWLRVEALEFPTLPSELHRAIVRRTVEKYGIETVLIDPLYRGLADADLTSVAQVGDAIVQFARSCQPAALCISHHAIKSAAREYGHVPELEDLSGAGVAESCGAWWLLGRNTPYQYDGQHDLAVKFGGRDEQGGAYRVEFDERSWRFELTPLAEYREQAAEAAADAREQAKAKSVRADAERVLRATVHVPGGRATRNVFRDLSGLNSGKFNAAWALLLREREVIQSGTTLGANKQTYPAFEVVRKDGK